MAKKYQRKIQRGIVMPVQQFINREKSAGVVLGISIVVAMILANSPWSEDYFHLFENKVGFFFNGEPYLYYSLHHWINDGLMSMFFFVVGLELKREFIGGELSDPRHTILPIGAAVAGMLVPALIYTLLNAGTGAGYFSPRWPLSTIWARWWSLPCSIPRRFPCLISLLALLSCW